jgi:hypothetical protein
LYFYNKNLMLNYAIIAKDPDISILEYKVYLKELIASYNLSQSLKILISKQSSFNICHFHAMI